MDGVRCSANTLISSFVAPVQPARTAQEQLYKMQKWLANCVEDNCLDTRYILLQYFVGHVVPSVHRSVPDRARPRICTN